MPGEPAMCRNSDVRWTPARTVCRCGREHEQPDERLLLPDPVHKSGEPCSGRRDSLDQMLGGRAVPHVSQPLTTGFPRCCFVQPSAARPVYDLDVIKLGLVFEEKRVVRRDDCITFLGADVRPSLATPSMIRWMEYCCRDGILPHLEDGKDTVGVKVSVEHLAPTPMGQEVTYTATVTEIDRRRLTLAVEASDGTQVVGKGTHVRFVVDVDRFAANLRKKFGQ